jgi:protein gp37
MGQGGALDTGGRPMGEHTAIEWTDHTFNPWWGCVEVSPACDHCYARELAQRFGHAVWGADAPRWFFGGAHWAEPLRWNRRAERAGLRARVFCASMADVLEERDDAVGAELEQARVRLWSLILATPHLDWLLLTKRPAAGRRLIPPTVQQLPTFWFGTTVETQAYAWRLDKLLAVPAAQHFVSVEPLLGPLDLTPWLPNASRSPTVSWVMCGGESGPGSRPLELAWARAIRDQCQQAGVAFFFKQVGGVTPKSGGCRLDGQTWAEFPASPLHAQSRP